MTTNLFVITNANKLQTQVVLEIYCLFFQTSWGFGIITSAIFNSFHNRVEFGMILEGLQNFGGGFEPPNPPRYATAVLHVFVWSQLNTTDESTGRHNLQLRILISEMINLLIQTDNTFLSSHFYRSGLSSCLQILLVTPSYMQQSCCRG